MTTLYALFLCTSFGPCEFADGPWHGPAVCLSYAADYNKAAASPVARYECKKIDVPAWEVVK